MKTLQLFSDEALERGRQMSTEEIVKFLDEFRQLYGSSDVQGARKREITNAPESIEISAK